MLSCDTCRTLSRLPRRLSNLMKEEKIVKLSAPKQTSWVISAVLGLLAILNTYAGLGLPIISGREFLALTLAFLLLFLATLFKGF